MGSLVAEAGLAAGANEALAGLPNLAIAGAASEALVCPIASLRDGQRRKESSEFWPGTACVDA
jgi:hypothetical protein